MLPLHKHLVKLILFRLPQKPSFHGQREIVRQVGRIASIHISHIIRRDDPGHLLRQRVKLLIDRMGKLRVHLKLARPYDTTIAADHILQRDLAIAK